MNFSVFAQTYGVVMKKYDLAIALRVYPGISKLPPVYSNNKYKLVEFCFESFVKFLGDIKPYIWIILDGCPEEYKKIFTKHPELDLEFIEVNKIGNAKTFELQLDKLLEQNKSEIIYFAEDDYFYLPNKMSNMLDFINNTNAHFLSPYDHPDYYNLELHNNFKSEQKIEKNVIWNTRASTTMTFMTQKSILKKTEKVFRTYAKNNWDSSLWLSLTKHRVNSVKFAFRSFLKNKYYAKIILKAWYYNLFQILSAEKYNLWVPTPSFSTHMDSSHLAPKIDWKNIFQHI